MSSVVVVVVVIGSVVVIGRWCWWFAWKAGDIVVVVVGIVVLEGGSTCPSGATADRHQDPSTGGIGSMRRKDHAPCQEAGGVILRIGRRSLFRRIVVGG